MSNYILGIDIGGTTAKLGLFSEEHFPEIIVKRSVKTRPDDGGKYILPDIAEGIKQLRVQIDQIDNDIMELLGKRMRVCREIGQYKKEHNIQVLQTGRYNEILDKRGAQGSLLGMSDSFAKEIFEHIHEESVRQQLEIVKG